MAAPSSSTVESGRHPKLIYSLWQDFISIKNSSNVIVNDVSNHLQLVMTNNFDFKDLLLRSDAAPVNEVGVSKWEWVVSSVIHLTPLQPSDHIVVDILYDSFLRSDTKQAAKFATEAEKTSKEVE